MKKYDGFKKKISYYFLIFIISVGDCALIFLGCGGGEDGGEAPSGTNNFGMTAYVAGYHPTYPDRGGVVAIDCETGIIKRIWQSDDDYLGIAVTPNGSQVIFTEYWRGTICIYDVNDDSTKFFQTLSGAFGVTTTSDSSYALVVSTNSTPTLTVIDLIAQEGFLIPIVDTEDGDFGSPRQITLTPNDDEAYISTGSYNNVVGYIAKADVTPEGDFSFERIQIGGDPSWGLAITPDGNYLYMASRRGTIGEVRKLNLNDYSDVIVIDIGNQVLGVAISPDGKWVYVSSGLYINIIDTSTDEVVNKVQTGNIPAGIAFTPDGKQAYVCSGGVYVIDCNTQTLVQSNIDVGFCAYAVAVAE